MPGALGREYEDFRQSAAVARLRDDPQSLGEEKPFLTPRLLVAQRAQALDGRVGECGDHAGHYSSPKRSSTSVASFSSASSAFVPETWMTMLSPFAAPSIIRP